MKELLSAQQAADLLGISKVALINNIKKGAIRAEKVGNSYVIDRRELPNIAQQNVSEGQKRQIEEAIDKTIKDYGEALRLLKDA